MPHFRAGCESIQALRRAFAASTMAAARDRCKSSVRRNSRNLYRRLADLEDEREIDAFGAEMADRIGPLPDEVRHLLAAIVLKSLCRRASVAKIEAGPKGR
jgi:transcription-repair coupling factor (superfamily II helicase)